MPVRGYTWMAVLIILFLGGKCFSQTGGGELDPAVVRILQPDARLLLGVQWRKTLASSTGDLIQKRMKESGLPSVPALAAFERLLREDIDSLLLSSSVRDVSATGRQTPLLVVVKGRFDPSRFREWIQGKSERYRKVELIAPGNVKPATTRVALLDATTILFGDRRELIAAIDRLTAPSLKTTKSPLLERAVDLAAKHDIWLTMDAPDGGFKGDTGPSAQMLSQVSGLELGVSLFRGFALEANLRAKSEEAAGALAAAVQGLLAMAALKQAESSDNTELLKKIQVAQARSAVSISLSLTEAEVAQSFARAQASAQTKTTVATTIPNETKPPPSKKIRITGLDSGPVELPMAPQK